MRVRPKTLKGGLIRLGASSICSFPAIFLHMDGIAGYESPGAITT
jgi:hypothetical protein